MNTMEELGQNELVPVERVLTQKMKVAVLAHFLNSVPIDRLGLTEKRKNMLARIEHVYWLYVKNPYLDVHAMFYELEKQHLDRRNAFNAAKADEKVFWFAVENSRPPSRKDSEMKVRAATDKLMRIGMETDSVPALYKGAALRMELDRLNQPESEQLDMSRMAFLPPVVTSNIQELDETKTYIDDPESKRLMQKYNAYVDEKRTMVEEKVAVMEARSVEGAGDE